ncbi:chemotaxis protein CheA [Noviherbaspirillum autotrophicum]|uniref:Chemotaxis protein CheA n=1 Tax=Noviherbaspirillum autotrophicum TaxID=709839 RepID=A0A0C1YNK1_9BURK|nr:chemotaxis protein CheA [Noviherbaspirillum autotrophicum]KIF82182.1 chemotaxis protein [Noviherbaspirillum autotrophicum]
MTIDMSQFFQVFFDETEELLAEMEKLLLAIDVASPDPEDLNAIFRAAHSIKGGAGTFGLTDLIDVTHVLESLLDKIRKGEMALSAEHVDAFLVAKDVLKMQLDGHRLQTPVDQEAVADARMMLLSLSQGEVAKAAPTASIELAPKAEAAPVVAADGLRQFRIELPPASERDVEALMAELGLLGQISKALLDDGRVVFTLAGHASADDIVAICSFILDPKDLKISEQEMPRVMTAAELKAAQEEAQGYGFFEPLEPTSEQLAAEKSAQEERQGYGFFDGFETPVMKEAREAKEAAAKATPQDVTAVASAHGHDAASNAAAEKKATPRIADKNAHNSESTSIRVGIEKVDQLINLVGELVITQAMIEQRTGSLDPMIHERLLNSVSQLTRNTRDLQEAVMSIRMMPMDYVFSRFPRMVRDLATKLGKRIEFVTHGAATELDKGLIERIVDPLTHLVRNSIDHGIEMPDVRLAAGKSEMGKLSLSAAHQGGNIIIEVTDDGGGLNREKILAKAKEKGLAVSDSMSDSDVWQLIFAPGFSTAEVVTDVSGRGVGMDVVKRNITAMGGVVDIRSAKGFGTTISISLPLTLAILDGMSIKVGEEIYILPLGYVVESLQPDPSDVKEITGQGRVIKVRGEYLPLIPLYQMFGIEPRFTDPSQGIVVILESDGKKAALFIDDLVGQQQVVVKNLESNYRKVAGISGATILGDGGVALIIDVAALLRSSRQLSDESIYS